MKNFLSFLAVLTVLMVAVQPNANAGDFYVLARFAAYGGQVVEVLEVGPPGGYTCDGSTAYTVKIVGQIGSFPIAIHDGPSYSVGNQFCIPPSSSGGGCGVLTVKFTGECNQN